MGNCRDCNGKGHIVCPVCLGSKKNPRRTTYEDQKGHISSTCSYCNGAGTVKCGGCRGTGNNPYDR